VNRSSPIPRVSLGVAAQRALSKGTLPALLLDGALDKSVFTQLIQETDQLCTSVVDSLNGESGAVIATLGIEAMDDSLLTNMAWNLFSSLCKPISQYATGELICNVRVSNESIGVSSYLTSNAAGGFHTDGTLLPRIPDICLLLCLSPADSGGATLLVDGTDIYHRLSLLNTTYVDTLACKVPFDSMGQLEDIPVKWQAVFTVCDQYLETRYMRYFIDKGFEKLGTNMPNELTMALDNMKLIVDDEALHKEAILGRGDLLLWNNLRFLHGRAPFTEQRRKRHLQRFYGIWDTEHRKQSPPEPGLWE
jgi:hypothetical protein